MTDATEPLTEDEKLWAFRRATHTFEGAKERWAERVKTGLTDEQLADALKYELGSMGGSSGHDNGIAIEEEGNGLKIWAARGWAHRHTTPPTWQGNATVSFARHVYGIADPDDKQMGLF